MKLFIIDNETTAYGAIEYSQYFNCDSLFISLSTIATKKLTEHNGIKFIEIKPSVFFVGSIGCQLLNSKCNKFILAIQKFLLFKRALDFFSKQIDDLNIDEVLVSNDRSYGNGLLLPAIKAGLNAGVKVSVVEYADFADEQRLYAVRERKSSANKASFITKWLFPQYVLQGRKGAPDIEMYSVAKLVLMKFNGCLSQNPKAVGGMLGVTVLVRNVVTLRRLVSLGCEKRHIQLIDDFFLKGGVSSLKSIDIAFALPQLSEHDLCSASQANEVHTGICDVLSRVNGEVVMLLHPKMIREQYRWISDQYNIKIYNGTSYEAIRHAKVFISTFSSLTHDAVKHCEYVHIYDPLALKYDWLDIYDSVSYSSNLHELTEFLIEYIK